MWREARTVAPTLVGQALPCGYGPSPIPLLLMSFQTMATCPFRTLRKDLIVLNTIIVVLIVMWLLGMVTAYTAGGLIHILLVIAIVVVLLRVIQGRDPFRG